VQKTKTKKYSSKKGETYLRYGGKKSVYLRKFATRGEIAMSWGWTLDKGQKLVEI